MGLQEEYDKYVERQRFYRSKKNRLKAVYHSIDGVELTLDSAASSVEKCTKDMKWKGDRFKEFKNLRSELSLSIDDHSDTVDDIQDAINWEANRANDKLWHYSALVSDTWTLLQNLTNG